MITNIAGYDELAEFIANLDPKKIIDWQPSENVQDRVELLIQRKKNDVITSDENYELEKYMTLEHLIAMSKARAKKNMAAA